MIASATDGAHLQALIRMALPLVRAAQAAEPARRGAPKSYQDWQVAAMALMAVWARRQTKSAQYRFLTQRREQVIDWLGLVRWPSRSTYF